MGCNICDHHDRLIEQAQAVDEATAAERARCVKIIKDQLEHEETGWSEEMLLKLLAKIRADDE